MSDLREISLEGFRTLADRAGLGMTEEELRLLKPLFDAYAEKAATLGEIDLGAEDLAVVFPPGWAPES